jgi:hypothetical protein
MALVWSRGETTGGDMFKAIVLGTALTILAASATLAETEGTVPGSLGEFFAAYDAATTPGHRAALELLVEGANEGLMSAEAEIEAKHGTPLYCQPANLALDPPHIIELLRIAMKDDARYRVVPVGFALLEAYKVAFPCSK